MPIGQYLVWVGSVLLMALFGAYWWLPDPVSHSYDATPPSERVNLRIRSNDRWPERVVFDTAHSGVPLAAGVRPELNIIPNQDTVRTEQRSALGALARLDRNCARPTCTGNSSAPEGEPATASRH